VYSDNNRKFISARNSKSIPQSDLGLVAVGTANVSTEELLPIDKYASDKFF
jgi:hypothetical protein